MATVNYQVDFDHKTLSVLAKTVLDYWNTRLVKATADLKSIGPRPKDDNSHFSEWAVIQREFSLVNDHAIDAAVLCKSLACCSSAGKSWTFDSEQLRWLYPEPFKDLIQSK